MAAVNLRRLGTSIWPGALREHRHFAFDFSPGDQRGTESTTTTSTARLDQNFGYLQGLLAGIGWEMSSRHVDAELTRINDDQRILGVDESRYAALSLCFGIT
jgi:hypothetical protein